MEDSPTVPVVDTFGDTDETDVEDGLGAVLRGRLRVPAGVVVGDRAVVGLVGIVVQGGPALGDPWITVPVTGVAAGADAPFELALNEDIPDVYRATVELGLTGTTVVFVVGAWEDVDADGAVSAPDRPLGVMDGILGLVPAPAPVMVREAGGAAGWNLFTDPSQPDGSARPLSSAADGVVIDASLLAVDPGSLRAVLGPETNLSKVAVDVRHLGEALGGTLPADPSVRQVLVIPNTDDFPFDLPAPWPTPPDAHHVSVVIPSSTGDGLDLSSTGSVRIAAYGLVGYRDKNGSGALDPGETVVARSWQTAGDRALIHVIPDDLSDALLLRNLGVPAGWSAVDLDAIELIRPVAWTEPFPVPAVP